MDVTSSVPKHSEKSGSVRQLKRLSSVQTLMPQVLEEHEDGEGSIYRTNFRQHGIHSKHLIGSEANEMPIKLSRQELSVEANQCSTWVCKHTTTEVTCGTSTPHNQYLSSTESFTADSQQYSSLMSGEPMASTQTCKQVESSLSENCPIKNNETEESKLEGEDPKPFLKSMAPDLTQTSNAVDLEKGEIAAEISHTSSPDLLKVDVLPAGREQRAHSVPARVEASELLVSQAQKGHDLSALETNASQDEEISDQSQTLIFGRFSSADELAASEQKAEELESKFVYMTATLSTQKETLDKRLEISERSKVSTEECLSNEVANLTAELKNLMNGELEKGLKEKLQSCEKHLQKIIPLFRTLANKSEVYGAVKQERKQLVASESMVMYVEHVKRLHARESTDHQATRLRLMKAQQEWSDVGDNSVNVNITRRSSTVGGSTQTLNKRRASVALTALPNILGGHGLKQLSMDPKSRFQQIVRRSSQSNHKFFRHPSTESDSGDYVELPGVTVNMAHAPTDMSATGTCSTPASALSTSAGDSTPRTCFGVLEGVADKSSLDGFSQLAVIKTISAVMPSVQTVEKPEKVEVRSTIRRRRSIKRSGTSGSQRNSIDHSTYNKESSNQSNRFSNMLLKLDRILSDHDLYRSCKEHYISFNRSHTGWRPQLRQVIFALLICIVYLQLKILLT